MLKQVGFHQEDKKKHQLLLAILGHCLSEKYFDTIQKRILPSFAKAYSQEVQQKDEVHFDAMIKFCTVNPARVCVVYH